MKIAIIDYGAGNIQSILFALKRLGVEGKLSADAEEIKTAQGVIFPGVGEASSAMTKLRATGLDQLIPKLQQPVLGICLGMQLMCRSTAEGNTKGLGIFDVEVKRFSPVLKVPQMGWNTIEKLKGPLFDHIPESSYMYLVHSYYAALASETVAQTAYGIPYSSALHKGNFYGVQFHPEKSSQLGQQLLQNFLLLCE